MEQSLAQFHDKCELGTSVRNMARHHFVLILLAAIGLPTLLTFFSLLHAHPRGKLATESSSDSTKSGLRALFSFHTPSTLFPPSAIISLTDDNSTFFLARPADFGPSLSSNGLSGQLWIGSGFGDDGVVRGTPGSGAEGELGCSDVPGWDEGGSQKTAPTPIANEAAGATGGQPNDATGEEREPSEDDGTDDHLHHPLPSSPVSKPAMLGQSADQQPPESGRPSTHADIQSLQESAEIAGKIVLLSRGGCGFLEKVKWTQRRGGTALIVGDQTRGGALITMYARGDTSNVTIPSLFTSHTTAHLLSSLIPPEDFDDDDDEGSRKGSNGGKDIPKNQADDDRPTFTPASTLKPTSISPKGSHGRRIKSAGNHKASKQKNELGLLKRLATSLGLRHETDAWGQAEDSRRPPSSGRLDWFSEKWTDESAQEREASSKRKSRDQDKKSKSKNLLNSGKDTLKSGSHSNSGDNFVIGVQDWRDPDLVVANAPSVKVKSTTTVRSAEETMPASKGTIGTGEAKEQKQGEGLKGGSITPGSGQYLKPGHKSEAPTNAEQSSGKDRDEKSMKDSKDPTAQSSSQSQQSGNGDEEHEGLWVTLTPTTMSSSPFFDTLLVLVVSPLVTLTVVYALLLLRSRIRRRRWRAPKSVVDRLPIRTYHTMSCGSTTSSTRLATPQASSPTTPLLHSSSHSIARSRPRSATASAIGDAVSASLDKATARATAGNAEKLASPKKKGKYTGKQVECVVCLEEYVDGQSRVMSLPCGHEFHAECM